MKSILLTIFFLLCLKNAFSVEFIEETEIYKALKTEQIQYISKITKKDQDKTNYLRLYLAHYNKIESEYEKLIFITSAQEYAYKNSLIIDFNYFYNYEDLILTNYEKYKDLSCFSMYFYYTQIDILGKYFNKLPNIFVHECQTTLMEDNYDYTLSAILNHITTGYLNYKNVDNIINEIYKTLSKKEYYKSSADFHLGLYAVFKLDKSKAIEQIVKLENYSSNDQLGKYFEYLLKLNYMSVYEMNNSLKYTTIFEKLEKHVRDNSLPINGLYLEAYASYTLKIIKNKKNIDLQKEQVDKFFKMLENNLTENQKTIIKKLILYLLEEDETNFALNNYIKDKISEKELEFPHALIDLNTQKKELEELYKNKKYRLIIDKYGYLNRDENDIWDISLTVELFDSYIVEKEIQEGLSLLLRNYRVLLKRTSDFESYATFKDDFEGLLNIQLKQAFKLFHLASRENDHKTRNFAGDIFFRLIQIKKFNELSNSLRTLDLKLMSKFNSEEMSILKDFIKLEQEVIKLNLSEEKNYELISKKKYYFK